MATLRGKALVEEVGHEGQMLGSILSQASSWFALFPDVSKVLSSLTL